MSGNGTARPGVDALAPYLDGVYLAVNAVPDIYLVHDAHDCGHYKAERIAGNHDLFSTLLRWQRTKRVVRTDVESRDYVFGSDDKLSKKIRQVATQYRPPLLVVAPSSVVAATGGSNPAVLADLRDKTGIPIAEIPARGLGGDHVAGYLDTVAALCRVLTFPPGERGNAVWVMGAILDRNEEDQLANAAEIKRLLTVCGLSPGPVLLDGTPYAELCRLPKPAHVLAFPGGEAVGRALADHAGAPLAEVPLPLGLCGTVEFMDALGRRFDVPPQAREPFDRDLSALVRQLHWVVPRFLLGRRTLVFADRMLLTPLCRALEELGCAIVGVGCTSSAESGRRDDVVPHPAGGHWPAVSTDLVELTRLLAAEADEREPTLVLGNAMVVQACSPSGIAAVELGYPSWTYHALLPRPVLGLNGVRNLVERIVNAVCGTYRSSGRR